MICKREATRRRFLQYHAHTLNCRRHACVRELSQPSDLHHMTRHSCSPITVLRERAQHTRPDMQRYCTSSSNRSQRHRRGSGTYLCPHGSHGGSNARLSRICTARRAIWGRGRVSFAVLCLLFVLRSGIWLMRLHILYNPRCYLTAARGLPYVHSKAYWATSNDETFGTCRQHGMTIVVQNRLRDV